MHHSIISRTGVSRGTISFLALLAIPALGQPSAPPAILTQATQAFSGSNPVNQVQLTGTVTWYAGSETDSGSATLTANASGQASMTLSLDSKGTWTESQTAFGSGMICQWSGSDGVAHQVDYFNCLKPVVWFLPSVSLQPSLASPDMTATDLGVGSLDGGNYRHLQIAVELPDVSGQIATYAAKQSATDVGLDPGTLLPGVLSYVVHPDDGSSTTVQIEVRYSDYQRIGGAMIPFHIQRYVDGSLQLDIQISSAQIG
jgi:hypothetical protein